MPRLRPPIRAVLQDFASYRLSSGTGITYQFWLPLVLVVNERPVIFFMDPRRTRGLTAVGRKFAFSMAHWRIRKLRDDLAEAALVIAQFPSLTDENGVEKRGLRLFTLRGR
jgi:hypothetical protein